MRNPHRIPLLLGSINHYWYANPDMRLMQLLLNIRKDDETIAQLYNMEDDELLRRLSERYG